MNENKLEKIGRLIKLKKTNDAQMELSKLGAEFWKDPEYLYLRSQIFYENKLYYLALDVLLIATEFESNERVYDFISKIYNILGNKELSENISNPELRLKAINSLKKDVTGILQKK